MSGELLDCGHPPSDHSDITTGYGRWKNEETGEWQTFCYACGAEKERDWMIVKGKTILYLVQHNDGTCEITDWPGELRFRVLSLRKGRHNIARVRYDVWFHGPDEYGGYSAMWWGVQYGDNTQLCHCKRIRRKLL